MNLPLIDPMVLRAADAPCAPPYVPPFVLECRGLTASYGVTARLRTVSAAFTRHRVTAILGPSGCGKSTLLKALNRTLELVSGARVDAGTVYLDGLDVYHGCAASHVRVA